MTTDTLLQSLVCSGTENKEYVYLILMRPYRGSWVVDSWYAAHEHILEYTRAKILGEPSPATCRLNIFAWSWRARYNGGEILHIRSETPLNDDIVEKLAADQGDAFFEKYRFHGA